MECVQTCGRFSGHGFVARDSLASTRFRRTGDAAPNQQYGAWRRQKQEPENCRSFYASNATKPGGRSVEEEDRSLPGLKWKLNGNQEATAILQDGQTNALDVLKTTEVAPASPWSLTLSQDRISMMDLIAPVADDLHILNENLNKVVGSESPLLMAAAEQIFSAGGKRMRPALVLLVSRATAELAGLKNLTPQHRQLAEIIEMIHTASLIHDDVLDESFVRRGKETIHQLYGTRIAVLAGDFLFAQTSWLLANLENIEVIKLISQVIKDFASGEIKQATSLFDCDLSLQDYLDKCYYKTASLVAASACSAAIFSGVSADIQRKMFKYGKNLGLAFQVVDDILDFTQSTENLGKPAGSDLIKGNLTAPVIFALRQAPKLRKMIESEFIDEGTLAATISLVHETGGIEKAHSLAKQKGDLARECLDCLPHGSMRSSLEGMVDYVLQRLC